LFWQLVPASVEIVLVKIPRRSSCSRFCVAADGDLWSGSLVFGLGRSPTSVLAPRSAPPVASLSALPLGRPCSSPLLCSLISSLGLIYCSWSQLPPKPPSSPVLSLVFSPIGAARFISSEVTPLASLLRQLLLGPLHHRRRFLARILVLLLGLGRSSCAGQLPSP
jgi:hypothetical protein